MTTDAPKARCSFCSKSDGETTAILAVRKDLFICDECVVLMVEIIAEGHDDWRKRLIEKLQTPPLAN
jgi:ATP-dependent protease Clp ATPase subunit